MRSDDLRALSAHTLAALPPNARDALEAFGIGPAPFDLDEPRPTAVILQWNDPAQVRKRQRATAALYRTTHPRRAAPTAEPQAPEPSAPPPSKWKREHIYPEPTPHTKLARDLALLSNIPPHKIAAMCRVPEADVIAMRAERTP